MVSRKRIWGLACKKTMMMTMAMMVAVLLFYMLFEFDSVVRSSRNEEGARMRARDPCDFCDSRRDLPIGSERHVLRSSPSA